MKGLSRHPQLTTILFMRYNVYPKIDCIPSLQKVAHSAAPVH
ncbi:hypothetical protein RRG08_021201 [Elysia crispata]|uniref:Uncharacterized protein n=1 Tax=Elysia crispata TaxID=231223 RepID=A0AAE0YNY5_9GAST|nr:hypothetical protein RRG08_021201 [Elysia crispata]